MSKLQTPKLCFQLLFPLLFSTFLSFFSASAQTVPLIKRTTYKTEKVDFGVGGTLTLIGAPVGNIIIEGSQTNEIEVSAEVEMRAETEADLTELAKVDGFVIDNYAGHVRIMSVGTHDKDYMKRTAKKFPKRLLNLPFKIDYHIKVPVYCDLEINGGRGDFTVSKVEGAMKINFLESNAKLNLTGGDVTATIGTGSVEMNVPTRSWRGRGLDIQLATGNLGVYLQPNFSADVDAAVLRTGKIDNQISSLKPRPRTTQTENSIKVRNGAGGAILSFTVGDGTIKISSEALKSQN